MAAHSVLAVADASYMVLSLEGPRWIPYAVKGETGKEEDILPGTILNLEMMQAEGEEFHYLPVSDEEMKGVVESVYEDLSQMEDAQGGAINSCKGRFWGYRIAGKCRGGPALLERVF